MTTDGSPEYDGGPRVPVGTRTVFKVVGVLACLGLVVLLALYAQLAWTHRHDQQTADANAAAATRKEIAQAQAFDAAVRRVAQGGQLTAQQLALMAKGKGIVPSPPAREGSVTTVEFRSVMVYQGLPGYEGNSAVSELCYRDVLTNSGSNVTGVLSEVPCASVVWKVADPTTSES